MPAVALAKAEALAKAGRPESATRLVISPRARTLAKAKVIDPARIKGSGPGGRIVEKDVRDYLERIGWNKQPPVPDLPEEVVSGTREKYLEIFRRLTGRAALED